MAGARHHAPRDPIILHLAPSPDVLRGLPGPPAGQVRACGQGAAGRGLHELERSRLLLQIRPHCVPIGDRAQAKYRGERKPGETPEFKDWREWEGEVASGHFYAEDLEQVRRELLAEGQCLKVVMRSMSEWRCLRLSVRGGQDCVICAFHDNLEVLQAWMSRLGLPYRGQRLAGAASEVFLHLLKARRDPPGSRQAVLAEQEYQCKLCAAPITAATCELDHIVPVHQSFSAQAQNLQALGLECHRNKTALEYSHATTLESRFSRRAYEAYVDSARLPPLVFKLNSHKPDHICHGIDAAGPRGADPGRCPPPPGRPVFVYRFGSSLP